MSQSISPRPTAASRVGFDGFESVDCNGRGVGREPSTHTSFLMTGPFTRTHQGNAGSTPNVDGPSGMNVHDGRWSWR